MIYWFLILIGFYECNNLPTLSCNNILFILGYFQVLKIKPEKKDIDSFVSDDLELIGYDPHKKIDMKMAV